VSIDLIYPGKDTQELVSGLSDDWIVSGPIRAAIHLANVWHMTEPSAIKREVQTGGKGAIHHTLNGVNIFGPNDLNHRLTHWAALNSSNYGWLAFYAQDLCAEYVKRFPHIAKHGAYAMVMALENMPDAIPEGEWTEPWFGKDLEYAP